MSYYRLKFIDADGRISYSPVVAVMNGKSGAELIGIYPSLVNDQAVLSITSSRATMLEIQISDMSGRVVKTIKQSISAGSSTTNLNTSQLASGTYSVSGIIDGVPTHTLRFVKQ
jgi:hypothetical protein